MKIIQFALLLIVWSICQNGFSQQEPETDLSKQRLIILADMGNEPDEEQQMIHMITCANEFELEGLIAVTGKYIRPDHKSEYQRVTHPELFVKIIDAYKKDLENLKKHADGWPEPDYLYSIVASGQAGYGIQDTGKNKSSEGSRLIIRSLTKDDPRPVWIVVNAGSNTLAQAIIDYSRDRSKKDIDEFISKMRVFENGAQDNAGAWISSAYPKIHWIRSNYQTYCYGGPGRNDGDVTKDLGPNYWIPYEYSPEGQNNWLKEHVMNAHGALGDIYPERRFHSWGLGFMEGGGTIPWMGLINKGLFDIDQPSWGGWGGRFSSEKVPNFWSRHKDIMQDERLTSPFYTYREVSDYWTDPKDGRVYNDEYVPVWRWRDAMYNDQICRMDWCVKSYQDANHHPLAAVNGDTDNSIIRLTANAGEILPFDASASSDPDGDKLKVKWWIYEEAGTYPGRILINYPNEEKISFKIPSGAAGKQIHLILEIQDINEIASLYDYRRIVIDVDNIVVTNKPVQLN